MLWETRLLVVHGERPTADSQAASAPVLRHGLVDRQPERWRAVNTGTDKLSVY